MSSVLKHTTPYVNLVNLERDAQGDHVMPSRDISVLFILPGDSTVITFSQKIHAEAAIAEALALQRGDVVALRLYKQ